MYRCHHRAARRPRAGKMNPKVVGCTAACVLLLLILVCGGGGAAGYFFWYKPKAEEEAKQAERQRLHDALTPELSSYLNLKTGPPSPGTKKFKGKVVCIDQDKKEIDTDAQVALPAALKAAKPDEVGAVALLSWKEEVSGDYPDGSKAKIYVVNVALIDKHKEAMLVFKEIRGDTQENKVGEGDRLGPKPFDKLVALLQEYADSN